MKQFLTGMAACAVLCGFADGAVTKVADLPYVQGQSVTTSGTDNYGSCVQTERTLTSKSVVEIELELVSTSYSGQIFCNRVSPSDRTYSLVYVKDKGWRFDYNNSNAEVYGGLAEVGRRYKLKLSPEGLWVDGVQTLTKTPADFTIPSKISFFAAHSYNTATEAYSYDQWSHGKMKLYSFKVSEPDENGALQLAYELRPCIGSNGFFGLWDSATGAVYQNVDKMCPLASTVVVRASEGAAGIVSAFNVNKSAAYTIGTTSVAYYSSYFNVALEPGVYDVSGQAAETASHLKMNYAKGGSLIGLGDGPEDVVLLGGGEDSSRRVLNLGAFTVTNLTVTGGNLTSTADGGGITTGSAGQGAVLGCIVSNNYAKGSNGNGGGGVWGAKSVRGCLIADNRSTNGGGLRSCTEIRDCIISNNVATSAGGGSSSGSAWNCVYVDNQTTGGGGGASGATLLQDCAFVRNTANGNGGGAGECTTISNCLFACNSAYTYGGGSYKAITCWDSTFEGNSIVRYGGGAHSGTYVNCAFVTNSCGGSNYGSGGGVGNALCRNCTFFGNHDRKSTDYYGATAADSTLVSCTVTNSHAVWCVFADTVMSNCVVRNCGKAEGTSSEFNLCGGFQNSTARKAVVNTVFDGCFGSGTKDRLAKNRDFVNCTIRGWTGASTGKGPLAETDTAVNTLVAGSTPYDVTADSTAAMTNCLYETVSGELAAESAVDCVQASPRWVKDGAGVLACDIRAASKAFNAGRWNDEIAALVGETDCAGRPRVKFGRIDIGALECQDDTLPGLMLLFR